MPQGRRDAHPRAGVGAAPRGAGLRPGLRASEAPRQALHALSVSLARHPDVVEFARSLAQGYGARDRMSRIAAAFTFVGHLVGVPPSEGECRDGVDVLIALAGEQEGPAVILAALLQALGEKASVHYVPGMAFVRVELGLEDLRRLPPYADLLTAGGRYYIPLHARECRSPLGVLPPPLRAALRAPRRA